MIRFTLFAVALGFAGCAQPAEQPAQAQAAANVALTSGTPELPPPAQNPGSDSLSPQQPASQSLPGFEYPADLGGKAVAKAVAPDKPALTPAQRFGTTPKTRTVPAKFLDPDPLMRVSYALPTFLPTKAVELRPAVSSERVPADLGLGAQSIPARPTFPVAAGVTERARDVNLPPAMPTLGRPLAERVSLDDPTSDFANATIVAPPVKTTPTLASFLKVTLPDPFELGDQVKPKVAPKDDPGLAPVVVNPQRVK